MEEPPEIESPVQQAELYQVFWRHGFKYGLRLGIVVGAVLAIVAGGIVDYAVKHQIEYKRLHPKLEAVYVP